MRMPKTFTRIVAAMGTTLGTDGAPGTPPTGQPGTQDNLLVQASLSDQGWPAHRIAVSYKGPVGALTLVGQIWLFDRQTQAWYEVGAPTNMVPNRLTYFDVVGLVSRRPTSADGLSIDASQGNIEALLVVQAAGGDPNGTYTFAMGADLTTLPV